MKSRGGNARVPHYRRHVIFGQLDKSAPIGSQVQSTSYVPHFLQHRDTCAILSFTRMVENRAPVTLIMTGL